MKPDYRDEIIRTVLSGLPTLPDTIRINLERAINTYVRIPGFRKSIKAPPEIIRRHFVESFKKTATITALVISAWTDLHPGLRDNVFQFLSSLHWELLPQSTDRTKLPGFYTTWLKGQEFDFLFESFKNQFPGDETSKDDICLMIVWLACRLPYKFEENIFSHIDEN